MFAEPLNGKKDAKPPPKMIAGHRFSWVTGMCDMVHSGSGGAPCNKLYSDIACAPKEAIGRTEDRGLWAAEGLLIEREWLEIQAENSRIMECCRS